MATKTTINPCPRALTIHVSNGPYYSLLLFYITHTTARGSAAQHMHEVRRCSLMILNADHMIDLTFKIQKNELKIKKGMQAGLRTGSFITMA